MPGQRTGRNCTASSARSDLQTAPAQCSKRVGKRCTAHAARGLHAGCAAGMARGLGQRPRHRDGADLAGRRNGQCPHWRCPASMSGRQPPTANPGLQWRDRCRKPRGRFCGPALWRQARSRRWWRAALGVSPPRQQSPFGRGRRSAAPRCGRRCAICPGQTGPVESS